MPSHKYELMVVKCNQFIDDDNLTDESSLIHLLDRHGAGDSDEIPLLKHSPFYSKNQFTCLLNTNYGLCTLDMNIANAFTKFDELEAFINRVNKGNPISIICLNECWLSEIREALILIEQTTIFSTRLENALDILIVGY